jgi:hypothetical protein
LYGTCSIVASHFWQTLAAWHPEHSLVGMPPKFRGLLLGRPCTPLSCIEDIGLLSTGTFVMYRSIEKNTLEKGNTLDLQVALRIPFAFAETELSAPE